MLLISPFYRPSQWAVHLLAPVPWHLWRGVLSFAFVPLGGGLLRQRPDHRLLLPGALPGHLSAPLRLSSLWSQKSRHRLLSLLGHCHACQHPPPPLHQVGSKDLAFFTFFSNSGSTSSPSPTLTDPQHQSLPFVPCLTYQRFFFASFSFHLSPAFCFSGTQSTRSPSSSSSSSPSSSLPSSMSPWWLLWRQLPKPQ